MSDFLDKAKDLAKDLTDKAKDTVTEHSDTIDDGIDKAAEFVDERPPYPSAHASTVVETPSGLVAAWFGGTGEGNADVGIWLAGA